jgi:hypothetical protein
VAQEDVLRHLQSHYQNLVEEEITPMLRRIEEVVKAQLDERCGQIRRSVWDDFKPLLDFLLAVNSDNRV